MTPTITAFERPPDRGRGLARDMRVRWALEEVGQAYDVRPVGFYSIARMNAKGKVNARSRRRGGRSEARRVHLGTVCRSGSGAAYGLSLLYE